jgi:hypothetical protein
VVGLSNFFAASRASSNFVFAEDHNVRVISALRTRCAAAIKMLSASVVSEVGAGGGTGVATTGAGGGDFFCHGNCHCAHPPSVTLKPAKHAMVTIANLRITKRPADFPSHHTAAALTISCDDLTLN